MKGYSEIDRGVTVFFFQVDIEEYSCDNSGACSWAPYYARDVQLEFVMLDPHLRMFLDPPSPNAKGADRATFSKTFKSPDVYGVFKFKILYRRVAH